jgi:hypothetical protein
MGFAAASGLRNAGCDPFAQNLALKLRKDRQETGHRPPGRCGEIQRFVERDKPDAQCMQLVQRIHQIDDGPSPPIQSPDHNRINLASSCGPHELIALRPLTAPRPHLGNRHDN